MQAPRATASRLRTGAVAMLLAAGSAALLVGGGLWFWWGEEPPATSTGAAPLAPRSVEPARAAPDANPAEPAAASAATVAAAPALPAASSVAVARPSHVNLELCGVGPVTIRLPAPGPPEAPFEPMPHPLGQNARAEAWPRVMAAMESSSEDRSRAAALVLQASGLIDAEVSPLRQTRQDATPFVSQLAALAGTTRDAGVLQWALSVCARAPNLAECQAISARDLVVLAPEDGRNWLLLAAVDAAGRDEALSRAAAAPVIGAMPSMMPAIEAAAPADLPPYLLHDMLVQAVGVEAALADPALFSAIRHCSAVSGEGRGTCLALADALQLRGTDFITLGIAWSMGGRQGWSLDRVAAAKAEEARLMAQLPKVDYEQPYSCPAVQRMRDWMRDRAALGERATLHRRAEAAASAATR